MSDHEKLVDVLDAAGLINPMFTPALAHIILDSEWGQEVQTALRAVRLANHPPADDLPF